MQASIVYSTRAMESTDRGVKHDDSCTTVQRPDHVHMREKEQLLERLDHVTSRTETIDHLSEQFNNTMSQIELEWKRRKEEIMQVFLSLMETIAARRHELTTHLEQEVVRSLQILRSLKEEHNDVISDTCQLADDCITAVQHLSSDAFQQTYAHLLDSCSQLEIRISNMTSPEDYVPIFLTQPLSLCQEIIHRDCCVHRTTDQCTVNGEQVKATAQSAKTEEADKRRLEQEEQHNEWLSGRQEKQYDRELLGQQGKHQRELSTQQEQHQKELSRRQEQHERELSRQLEQHQTELLTHQEEAIDLRAEIEQLEGKLATQLAHHDQLESRFQRKLSLLQLQVDDVKAINFQLKERQKMLVSQRDQYKEQVKQLRGKTGHKEIVSVSKKCQQEERTEADGQRSEIDQLKHENPRDQLEQCKEEQNALLDERAGRETVTSKHTMQNSLNEVDHLKQKLESQNAKLEQYKNQVSSLHNEMTSLKTKHGRQFRACRQQHSAHTDALQEQILMLKAQHAMELAKWEERNRTSELFSLRHEIATERAKSDQLKKELETQVVNLKQQHELEKSTLLSDIMHERSDIDRLKLEHDKQSANLMKQHEQLSTLQITNQLKIDRLKGEHGKQITNLKELHKREISIRRVFEETNVAHLKIKNNIEFTSLREKHEEELSRVREETEVKMRSVREGSLKVKSLEYSLEHLTKVHKQFAEEITNVRRVELPMLKRRLLLYRNRATSLESSLKETRDRAAREMERYQMEIEHVTESARQGDLLKTSRRPKFCKPIRPLAFVASMSSSLPDVTKHGSDAGGLWAQQAQDKLFHSSDSDSGEQPRRQEDKLFHSSDSDSGKQPSNVLPTLFERSERCRSGARPPRNLTLSWGSEPSDYESDTESSKRSEEDIDSSDCLGSAEHVSDSSLLNPLVHADTGAVYETKITAGVSCKTLGPNLPVVQHSDHKPSTSTAFGHTDGVLCTQAGTYASWYLMAFGTIESRAGDTCTTASRGRRVHGRRRGSTHWSNSGERRHDDLLGNKTTPQDVMQNRARGHSGASSFRPTGAESGGPNPVSLKLKVDPESFFSRLLERRLWKCAACHVQNAIENFRCVLCKAAKPSEPYA